MADEAEGARSRLLYDLGCAFTARIELNDLLPFIIEKYREALAARGRRRPVARSRTFYLGLIGQ